MRPISIPKYIKAHYLLNEPIEKTCWDIHNSYKFLQKKSPEVSIVIPAYNEEANILQTLSSLSKNLTDWSVEIIVVNNNSKDNTANLANASGVRCILEKTQGITAARNAGLIAAKGTYVLNADADTIYPVNWIESMIKPLHNNKNIAVVYGNFAFIPTQNTPRFVYFVYEYLADIMRWFNANFKEEAMNVYGFNSGFRKQQGDAVNGFEHPDGTNEDGWLAVKLREKGFGKLYCIKDKQAIVWTTDRRIQQDGGLLKGILKRFYRLIGIKTEHRTDL
jgi:glycosyltransferase involved in cell wall biosynthesis